MSNGKPKGSLWSAMKWSKEETARLVELRKQGLNKHQIAAKLDRSSRS